MEALKLKIFDVLTEKIKVSEFENWLYNSEYLETEIKGDSLFFDVVNINYRKEDSISLLERIASKSFTYEELLAIKIVHNCIKIRNSKNTNDYKEYVQKIIVDLDFDNEFDVFWKFYSLYYSFDGYDYCEYENIYQPANDFKAKELANSTIDKLKFSKSIKEKVELLKQKEEGKIEQKNEFISTYNPQIEIKKHPKQTFSAKFLAFFKKI